MNDHPAKMKINIIVWISVQRVLIQRCFTTPRNVLVTVKQQKERFLNLSRVSCKRFRVEGESPHRYT
jgi:hypothetical protein